MLPPKQHKAYCNFYDAVRSDDRLDARTTAMIGLAAAMARECQP
ncbi:MAG: carboxymuconolactone decarboxylase family protein [Desulfuromonadales bacterium]